MIKQRFTPRVAIFLAVGVIILLSLIVVVTAALTPPLLHPAYAAAERFIRAAGEGNEATAFALLTDPLQAYVRESCPQGAVTACIASYTPPEWGGFVSGGFRRARPDTTVKLPSGDIGAYDVDLIAVYAEDKGFSGVCIYTRVEQDAAGEWRIAEYAGYVWCGEAASRNMADNPEAPNRAP